MVEKGLSFISNISNVLDCCSGLIYRHYRPVHYSYSSRSALAEAELVYKDDHVSHSVYVTFSVDQRTNIKNQNLRQLVSTESNVGLLVWTTTPWTLTANMVCHTVCLLVIHNAHLGYCSAPESYVFYR